MAGTKFPEREICKKNVAALEKFIRKTIDQEWNLEWIKDKGVIRLTYSKKRYLFRTVNVSGDSFLGCCRDVFRHIE